MRWSALIAAIALIACTPEYRAELPTIPGHLVLPETSGDPELVGQKFTDALRARYGERPGLEAVKLDLIEQGFRCREVPPVEGRGDYLIATCEFERVRRHCAETWIVDLRYAATIPAKDSVRIRPSGSFRRSCS